MNHQPLTVPALVYHKVGEIPADCRYPCNYVRPRQFARQLRWLQSSGFTSVTVSQYVASRTGRATLPPRPIIITFDDGYRSLLDSALPMLREAGFTATVFLVSALLGKSNEWDDERQEPLLDVHEVRSLAGTFDFQSHTASHARLTDVPLGHARAELERSRMDLEQMLGARVSVIAYPWSAYDERVCTLAEETGYEAGVIMRRRTNFAHTPLMELRRIGVNHTTSLSRFAWDLARLRWRGE